MANIVSTVEFYFSDKNLLTDVHLHGLISSNDEGWVYFVDLLKFPKLRRLVQKQVNNEIKKSEGKLNDDIESKKKLGQTILADLLESSKLLDVNKEQEYNFQVRRCSDRPSIPYLPKQDDPLLHLVLDSGGLIHSTIEELRIKAHNFWTIPEVLGEIRDKKTRLKLEHLPFELKTKEPSDEAMKFVVDFSKKSGEYGTLSFVDLKVLALAYHLEKQESGDAHLRSEPLITQVSQAAATVGTTTTKTTSKTTSSTPATSTSSSTSTLVQTSPLPFNENKEIEHEMSKETSPDLILQEDEDNGSNDKVMTSSSSATSSDVIPSTKGMNNDDEKEENIEDDKEKDDEEDNNNDEEDDNNDEGKEEEVEDDDSSIEDLGSDDDWDPNASQNNNHSNISDNKMMMNDNDKFADAESDSEEDEDGLDDIDDEEEDDIDDNGEFDDKLFHGSSKAKGVEFFDQFNNDVKSKNVNLKDEDMKPEIFSCQQEDFPSLSSSTKPISSSPSSSSLSSSSSSSETATTTMPGAKPIWGKKTTPSISGGGSLGGNAMNPVQWQREEGNVVDKTITIGGKNMKSTPSSSNEKDDKNDKDKVIIDSNINNRSSHLIGSASAGISSGGIEEEDDGIGWFGVGIAQPGAESGSKLSKGFEKSNTLDPFKPANTSTSLSFAQRVAMKPSSTSTSTSTSSKNNKKSDPKDEKKEQMKATNKKQQQSKQQKQHKQGQGGGVQGLCLVARSGCVTTDYAMQSILLQIGLRLLSVDGKIVRKIQQFVLRCNACFQIQSNTTKLFCDRCGSSHLSRIASSLDKNTGKQILHLKKDFKYKMQGTQYSIPKPGSQRKGRFGGEVVLREDQMLMGIWAQKTAPKAKEKTSMFGAEVNEKTGVNIKKSATTVVVGYGRSNPNALKGRERRGKKKRSTK